MSRPIVLEHNVETNEVIEREMNDAEFANYQAGQAAAEARLTELEAQAASKAALLAKLGITEEEAKLLLS